MDSLLHPSELIALISFKLFAPKNYFHKEKSITYNSSLERTDSRTDCYRFLNLTSRSFAAVVQALDVELRDAVRALIISTNLHSFNRSAYFIWCFGDWIRSVCDA